MSKKEIKNGTWILRFSNPLLTQAYGLTGLSWMAKHYIISNIYKGRIYSACYSLDSQVEKYRNYLLEMMRTGSFKNSVNIPQEVRELTFVIKSVPRSIK